MMRAQRIRVGLNGDPRGYVEARNISSLPFRSVDIVRTYDVFNVFNMLDRRILRRPQATTFLNCMHWDAGIHRVDVFHFFNTVSLSRTPWMVTSEHYVPRWDPHSTFGLKLLAGSACRKIIALSTRALVRQKEIFERYPQWRDTLLQKTCILHPAQPLILQDLAEKPTRPPVIRFAFVGRDFFRKGGKEILLAFESLLAEGFPVHLTIVSDLAYGDYASRSTLSDQQWARALIRQLHPHVEHVDSLAPHEVLRLFTASDVGLLPTYDDTYGYSVLEAQACGCPVISTDVCALPEINSDTIGWMLAVPKDQYGSALGLPGFTLPALSDAILHQLLATIRALCANRHVIPVKAAAAINHIRTGFSPEDRAATLERWYHEALGG